MRPKVDLLPLIVLACLAGLLAGGYLLYPSVFGLIHRTDCVASGRTDCG